MILLLAKTRTETGELPMFSGKENLKSLLLMNRASSFKSNREEGRSPLNLLNRMSRNLRAGRERITEGNSPEKSLLLISSSKRRVRHRKESGMVPQKRLELM